MNWGRLLTAMVTPFNDANEVDLARTTILVEHLIATGTDALIVGGTTGESPTLTKEEKVTLFQHVISVVNGRIPVILGTGSNNTAESIAFTQKAEEMGADGVMLVAPYYNKPSQEGLYQHFKAIANATKLPVMLYNIPGRTGINMDVDTIVRLAHIPNIECIKEASADLIKASEIIRLAPEGFQVFTGDDGLTVPTLAVGGTGVVSVLAHISGLEMKKMIHHFLEGNTQEAARIHRKLVPVVDALFMAPNPTAVKAALQLKGFEVGGVRLPLVPLTDNQQTALQQCIDEL